MICAAIARTSSGALAAALSAEGFGPAPAKDLTCRVGREGRRCRYRERDSDWNLRGLSYGHWCKSKKAAVVVADIQDPVCDVRRSPEVVSARFGVVVDDVTCNGIGHEHVVAGVGLNNSWCPGDRTEDPALLEAVGPNGRAGSWVERAEGPRARLPVDLSGVAREVDRLAVERGVGAVLRRAGTAPTWHPDAVGPDGPGPEIRAVQGVVRTVLVDGSHHPGRRGPDGRVKQKRGCSKIIVSIVSWRLICADHGEVRRIEGHNRLSIRLRFLRRSS